MKIMNSFYTRILKAAALLCLIFAPINAFAQFSSTGDDPGRVRWSTFESEHYKIVFPRGMDSIAQVYGRNLERFHTPISRSGHYKPGQLHKRKLPVVLHAYTGESNGSVAWAPKRMDFYMLPDAYKPDPIPWEKYLSIHESRHAAQMQLGYDGVFRPFTWFFGDIFVSGVSALYSNNDLKEGDAVVTETALTNSGRGRSGDFLNYYASAFNTGDFRNYYKWKHGSWRTYYPSQYALGYMVLGGARTFYDYSEFMDSFYSRVSGSLLRLGEYKHTVAVAADMEFEDAFMDIVGKHMDIWNESAQQRGPFTQSEFVTAIPSWYEEYSGASFVGEDMYVQRSGLLRSNTLTKISPDGKVRNLRQFSMNSSKLVFDPGRERLYWTETVNNPRWTLAGKSKVKYIRTDKAGNTIHTLTRKGRYYNPAPSPDGTRLAVVEYPYTGGSAIVILDAEKGRELEKYTAPSGLRLAELVWTKDNRLVMSATNDYGIGIYTYSDGFKELLVPQPVYISGLRADGNDVIFSADRTGVNEIYRLTQDGVEQLTSTQYGAKDGVIHNGNLYYTTQQTGLGEGKKVGEGRLLHKAAVSGLMNKKVDFADIYKYPVAEALSEQERMLGGIEDFENMDVEFSQTKPYRKLPNIPRFHSWAPVRVQMDNFANLNFDKVSDIAGLGATAFFQNDHGTASGSVAYGYSPGSMKGYRNSGHVKFTYTGFYPVIELSANIGRRPASRYDVARAEYPELIVTEIFDTPQSNASVDASVEMYIPWSRYSGGWVKGFTPRVKYTWSNDKFNKSIGEWKYKNHSNGIPYFEHGGVSADMGIVNVQTLTVSLTGYLMQTTPAALEYPKWGIGAEYGYNSRLSLSQTLGSMSYLYLYGYLPGLTRQQGAKLTVSYQRTFDSELHNTTSDIAPRGFKKEADIIRAFQAHNSSEQLKLTADYSIPFKMEFGHKALFRVTHFVVKPHYDCTLFSFDAPFLFIFPYGSMHSVGSEFNFKLANILYLPFDATIGVSLDYNKVYGMQGVLEKYSVVSPGFVFKLDL